ncbi:MAG TPA: Rrf2 family transcriptional regulator [Phycisphaerae bacterium]|nr:Rrf2 family transcriptional regulator [Phycisphaerae bacterium]
MATELAVRGILVLAGHGDSPPVSLKEICRVRGLSRDNMTRIFALLTRARLVNAVRGKNGGYRLARPASEITLLEVFEAVEGPLALNLCQQDPPQCDRTDCAMRQVWHELQEQVHAALAEKTLEDFACVLP